MSMEKLQKQPGTGGIINPHGDDEKVKAWANKTNRTTTYPLQHWQKVSLEVGARRAGYTISRPSSHGVVPTRTSASSYPATCP